MPRSHADYVRAAKLGWARRHTKTARRSLAAVKGWRGRRSPAKQKRAESRARGALGPFVKAERRYTKPVVVPPTILSPSDLHAAIRDAAWAALKGQMESALALAVEAQAGQKRGVYSFAIRAKYLLPDGEIRWVSLTPLTPLEGLGVALIALSEKARLALAPGYFQDDKDAEKSEVKAGLAKLEDTSVYLTDGVYIWSG